MWTFPKARSRVVTKSLKRIAMRRALVLTNEAARHPFRASLPPHVTERSGEVEQTVPWHVSLGLTRQNFEWAAATYCAGFVGTLTFFA